MLTDFHETVETGMLPCLHGISDFSLAVIDNPLGISTICISTGRSRISVYSIFFGFTQTCYSEDAKQDFELLRWVKAVKRLILM